MPVFCFDPRFYDAHVKKYDIRKCGVIRTKFNLQAVQSLRTQLEQVDSLLLVAHDRPENFLAQLIDSEVRTTIVYQQEVMSEELKVEARL